MPQSETDPNEQNGAAHIEDRARFDIIRYANCWEDAGILCRALEPGPGRRFLSIASGGDNSFALLAQGAEVVAVDLSPAQLACVELKAAAIRRFDHPDVLAFLGVRASQERATRYHQLRTELSRQARVYWDANEQVLERGLIHAGKFERFFRLFRTRILPLVHRRRTVMALMQPRSAVERKTFYEQHWSNLRWRLLFRVFMSRFVMGRLGRDPEFFRYVEGSVADRILARTGRALSSLPLHTNPYLEYILTGAFTRNMPHYLDPDSFDALRQGLDRLTLHLGSVEEAGQTCAGPGFDGFNLSDIFEYLDADTCRRLYAALLEHARPGARFVYWNMLVPRRCPTEFRDRVRDRADLAGPLFEEDAAFFYSAFVVEEV
jgi:S-adenosylmethionine-diacylglycerol 3-amino-3-carboxypropyl transferase